MVPKSLHRAIAPLVVSIALLTTGCAAATPASTAGPGTSADSTTTAAPPPAALPQLTPGSTGWDVSYPQGTSLPEPKDFAIVGVNGALPTEPNPDFSDQIAWAGKSKQPPMLYVNAANPAGFNTASWPKDGTNRFGTCDGGVSAACSYQYGQDRIRDDLRFISPHTMKGTTVFITVEPNFSWRDNQQTSESNVATLEGMSDAIRDAGGQPGIYSTGNDWRSQITSDAIKPSDVLYGLPIWWAGAHDINEAKANCTQASFTGGKILVTQIPAENAGVTYDQDVAC